jgi:hypothetical protein
MSTVAKVNARVDQGNTSQGFYVVAADGTAFGFNNNRSIERVLAFMADGLKKFQSTTISDAKIEPLAFAPVAPPDGATVLRVYSRVLPTPENCNESNKNLQRDHFWVLAEEAESLAQGAVSESLQLRLCRFALVDAVRGEPDFWRLEHIKSRVFEVVNGPEGKTIVGSFSMLSGRQSLVGRIEAAFTVSSGRVTAFKGYAECTASGSGTYTPGAPEGKFPLKFAFVLAPATRDTVAPQAAMFGREYLTGK